MQRWTCVFLVVLRLSIGWHFLFEGLHKIHSIMIGPTATSRPFSSAGYFREATGPLGSLIRATNGDPDDEALARLITRERQGDPANDKPHTRLPAGLKRDWQNWVDRFAKHYGFPAAEAAGFLEQQASAAVSWLEYEPDPVLREVIARFGKIESVDSALLNEKERAAYDIFLTNSSDQTITFSTGDVKRRMTMAERIADYRAKLADIRDRSGKKLWSFGKDVEGPRLRAAKAEITKLRTGLLEDLDREQTAVLIQALNVKALGPAGDSLARVVGLLKGPEAKAATELMKMPTTPIAPQVFAEPLKELAAKLTNKTDADALTEAIKGLPEFAPLPPTPTLEAWQARADWLTACGLTTIGACLVLGLLTRLNCWLAALFLFMTYLTVPPFPWLPVVGPQEGNYVFVNKNIVEMFACCVLGTLPTGQWFGADRLLSSLWYFLTGQSRQRE